MKLFIFSTFISVLLGTGYAAGQSSQGPTVPVMQDKITPPKSYQVKPPVIDENDKLEISISQATEKNKPVGESAPATLEKGLISSKKKNAETDHSNNSKKGRRPL